MLALFNRAATFGRDFQYYIRGTNEFEVRGANDITGPWSTMISGTMEQASNTRPAYRKGYYLPT